jgi:hypothetical protein
MDLKASGRVSIGAIVSRTFELVGREWRSLGVLSVLFVLAPSEIGILWNYAVFHTIYGSVRYGGNLVTVLGYLARIACLGFGYAAAIALLLAHIDGYPTSVRTLLAKAGRSLPVSLTALAVSNAPLIYAVAIGAPRTFASYLLLILSGSVTAMAWSTFLGAALPVAVDDGVGLVPAIARAARLSRGQRWRLAAIALAFQAVFLIGEEMSRLVGGWLLGYGAVQVEYAWLAVVYIPVFAMSVAIYRELSRVHGGISVSEASRIFD